MTPLPNGFEITNRTMWLCIAVMLAIYVIWVLEDLVRATRKPIVMIFEKTGNLIEGDFKSKVDWDAVDLKEEENVTI